MSIARSNTVLSTAALLLAGVAVAYGARLAPLRDERVIAEAEAIQEEQPDVLEYLDTARTDRDRFVEIERLAEEIARETGLSGRPPLPSAVARQVLPYGTLFVSFSVSDEKTIVMFYFGPEEPVYAYSVDVQARRLERIADGFHDAVAYEPARPNLRAEHRRRAIRYGRELFQLLFLDADGERGHALDLLQRARNVIVSPSGPLVGLPFSALVMNAAGDPEYLGLEKALSYAPNLMFLVHQARLRERRDDRREEALILGDPAFATESDGESADLVCPEDVVTRGEEVLVQSGPCPVCGGGALARLPGARHEAARVARLLGTRPLLGTDATEVAFRARAARATQIHVAAHFHFCQKDPLASALLLARSEQDGVDRATDGRLELREIADGISLEADLVVLSACSTGIETGVRGVGGVGLATAMLRAGARTVVATHWPVEDLVSGEIMGAFHENLHRGVAKAEALRLAMRAAAKSSGLSAHHWAGFMMVGDPV